MTAVFLDKVIGFVDKRLVLTSLLPSAVFWATVATLTGGQIGWTRVRKWWTHLDTGTHLLLTVVAVALLVLFALLLSAQEGAILRFYEGYWGRRIPGRWLSAFGVRRQQKKVGRLNLNDDSQFEYRYRNFPRLTGDVMPTRLGNILRASERYPADEERYSMDAVFFWPRLIAVVPGSVRANLSDARASLALLLNVCTLAIVLAVGAIVALAVSVRPLHSGRQPGARRCWRLLPTAALSVLRACTPSWCARYLTCTGAICSNGSVSGCRTVSPTNGSCGKTSASSSTGVPRRRRRCSTLPGNEPMPRRRQQLPGSKPPPMGQCLPSPPQASQIRCAPDQRAQALLHAVHGGTRADLWPTPLSN